MRESKTLEGMRGAERGSVLIDSMHGGADAWGVCGVCVECNGGTYDE